MPIATLLRHHLLLEVVYTRNIGCMYTYEAYLIQLNSLFMSLPISSLPESLGFLEYYEKVILDELGRI